MKFNISIFLIVLAFVLFLSTIASTQDIQKIHIDANLPETIDEFDQILSRDIKAYFTQKFGTDIIVRHELLRRTPTQSGIAYPKFYAWVRIEKNGSSVDAGALRIVAIDGKRIAVTDFFSQEKIKTEPKSIELVFPRSLCDNIRNRAGLR
jgi:hypothetical protein